MKDRKHLLISLEERHAENILAGTKTVELRRRTMHVDAGSIVWFYVKKPRAAVVGYAEVGHCETASPKNVWQRFGDVSGLEKREFMDYFQGAACAFAMGVTAPKTLESPVSLQALRKASDRFHPPQFYAHIVEGSRLRKVLEERAQPKKSRPTKKEPA